MGFGVDWEAEAEEDLAHLPPVLASFVLDEVDHLAGNPVALSKPSHFPYRPAQAYPFSCEFEGRTYYLTVLFHYRQDEQAIVLDAIGCMPLPPKA
jgi:hypothetical protein